MDFKLNSEGKVKFYEVNPRLCSNVVKKYKLFQAIYIPLAFEIQKQKQKQTQKIKNNCNINISEFCEIDEYSIMYDNTNTYSILNSNIHIPNWYKNSHPLYNELGYIAKREKQFVTNFLQNKIPFNYKTELTEW